MLIDDGVRGMLGYGVGFSGVAAEGGSFCRTVIYLRGENVLLQHWVRSWEVFPVQNGEAGKQGKKSSRTRKKKSCSFIKMRRQVLRFSATEERFIEVDQKWNEFFFLW